jgi:hypothetical protein
MSASRRAYRFTQTLKPNHAFVKREIGINLFVGRSDTAFGSMSLARIALVPKVQEQHLCDVSQRRAGD